MNVSTPPTTFGSAELLACPCAAGLSGWPCDHGEVSTGQSCVMQLLRTLTMSLQNAASRWLYNEWAIFMPRLST